MTLNNLGIIIVILLFYALIAGYSFIAFYYLFEVSSTKAFGLLGLALFGLVLWTKISLYFMKQINATKTKDLANL